MGVGVVNSTSNVDSIIRTFAYLNAWILELAKGVWIIEVGLYSSGHSLVVLPPVFIRKQLDASRLFYAIF